MKKPDGINKSVKVFVYCKAAMQIYIYREKNLISV